MPLTKLFAFDHPTYLRRLVRALNAVPDGYYAMREAQAVRCHRASLHRGKLLCVPISGTGSFAPANHIFTDAYARQIHASRVP